MERTRPAVEPVEPAPTPKKSARPKKTTPRPPKKKTATPRAVPEKSTSTPKKTPQRAPVASPTRTSPARATERVYLSPEEAAAFAAWSSTLPERPAVVVEVTERPRRGAES